MSERGFIRPRGVAAIKRLPARGLRTALDLNGAVVIFHRGATTIAAEVTIKEENNAPIVIDSGLGTDQQLKRLRIRGFDPLPLAVNDWFTTPGGDYGVITRDVGVKDGVATFEAQIAEAHP